MSKKTTARKTSRTKTAKLPPAPRGLSLFLSMLDNGNPDDAIHARAQEIVEGLRQGFDASSGTTAEVEADTRMIFPGLDICNPQPIMKAGMMLGAAVAWILMTDLQGGVR